MMIDDLTIFSDARLFRYRLDVSDTNQDILNRYLWNIRLSEAFYPALAIFEVVLRNRIDQAVSAFYETDWLNETWENWPKKGEAERLQLIDAKAKLLPHHQRGHLIAELTLGFWIALFRRHWKPILWQKRGVFDQAFPGFNQDAIDRAGAVCKRLETIRILRNRISHHEPIFDIQGGVDKAYNDLAEVVFWLSPEASALLKSVSRFQEVWQKKL